MKFFKLFLIGLLCSVAFAAQSSEDLFNRAKALYSEGKFAYAEILFRKAQDRGAPLFETSFDIANCLFQQEKFPEAAAAYRKAVDASDGKSAPAIFNLASVLFRLGEFPESVAAYRRGLLIDPSNVSAWEFLGEASSRSGDKVGALRAFTKASNLDPDDIGLVYRTAESEIALGDAKAAVKRVREAYAHHPEEVDFLVYAGDVERTQKNFIESAAFYKEALSARSDNKDVMYKLADALSESGNPYAAMETLSEILAIDPKNADAAIFLGNLAFDAHWYERAESAYLLAAEAGDSEALYGFRNLAYEWGVKSNTKESLRILEVARKFYPNDRSLLADIAEYEAQISEQ
ncbi:MAG: tetratricopeptide repeat protein [Fibrobacteraceae bacterium]